MANDLTPVELDGGQHSLLYIPLPFYLNFRSDFRRHLTASFSQGTKNAYSQIREEFH